jgi:hypothetical protein
MSSDHRTLVSPAAFSAKNESPAGAIRRGFFVRRGAKNDPVFHAIGSGVLYAAIDAIFGGRRYERPKDWGAFFIAFPSEEEWGVPIEGWHIDANLQEHTLADRRCEDLGAVR